MKYLYTFCFWRLDVSRIINQMLFFLVKAWSESGPKEAANSFKLLLDVFVLQKIEVCYLLLNCWCLLNELDVIVIVVNRRLSIES